MGYIELSEFAKSQQNGDAPAFVDVHPVSIPALVSGARGVIGPEPVRRAAGSSNRDVTGEPVPAKSTGDATRSSGTNFDGRPAYSATCTGGDVH